MARNHQQVIERYRKIKMEHAALGMKDWICDRRIYFEISKQVDYEVEVVKKIIQKHKKTEEWKDYDFFLDNIPSAYDKIKDYLTKHIVYSRIYNEN